MAKKTYREELIEVKSIGGEQVKKLDQVIEENKTHYKESDVFRLQQATNTEAIKNIKEESLPTMRKLIFAGYALAGSTMLTLLGVLIKVIFFTK